MSEEQEFVECALCEASHYRNAQGKYFPLMMSGFPRWAVTDDAIAFSDKFVMHQSYFEHFGIAPVRKKA